MRLADDKDAIVPALALAIPVAVLVRVGNVRRAEGIQRNVRLHALLVVACLRVHAATLGIGHLYPDPRDAMPSRMRFGKGLAVLRVGIARGRRDGSTVLPKREDETRCGDARHAVCHRGVDGGVRGWRSEEEANVDQAGGGTYTVRHVLSIADVTFSFNDSGDLLGNADDGKEEDTVTDQDLQDASRGSTATSEDDNLDTKRRAAVQLPADGSDTKRAGPLTRNTSMAVVKRS